MTKIKLNNPDTLPLQKSCVCGPQSGDMFQINYEVNNTEITGQLFWTSLIFLGGRSGIIWNKIFMIPVFFTSVIHDTYKDFLPDSWFTKKFDHPIDLIIFSVAT